jgi:hypothetical protein
MTTLPFMRDHYSPPGAAGAPQAAFALSSYGSGADIRAVRAFATTGQAAAAGTRPSLDADDWSGGFDFHLGVYTND